MTFSKTSGFCLENAPVHHLSTMDYFQLCVPFRSCFSIFVIEVFIVMFLFLVFSIAMYQLSAERGTLSV